MTLTTADLAAREVLAMQLFHEIYREGDWAKASRPLDRKHFRAKADTLLAEARAELEAKE